MSLWILCLWLVVLKTGCGFFEPAAEPLLKNSGKKPAWTLKHPLQNLYAYSGNAGVTHVGAGNETFSLRTTGTGRAGSIAVYAPPFEWWKNTAQGIEQGWELQQSAEGQGCLYVDVAVGGVKTDVSPNQQTVFFSTKNTVFEYGTLAAWDSEGTSLPVWFEEKNQGVRIWVDDEMALYPIVLDPLFTRRQIRLDGPMANATFGSALSAAGDVNGDGFGDIVVGAEHYNYNPITFSGTGAVYLYYGSAQGIVNPSSAPFVEGMVNGRVGAYRTVSGAGNINGDGFADIVVGSPTYENGQSVEGRVRIYTGSASGVSLACEFESNTANASLGSAVSDAGDMNGDGFSDVVAASAGESALYLYSGNAVSNCFFAKKIQNNTLGFHTDMSLSPAGDVNGDGYGDIVMGVGGYDGNKGVAYVFYGASSMDAISNTPAWQKTGSANQQFGVMVSGAGDVNGDGYSDISVGTNESSGPGKVFIFHGSSNGISNTAASVLTGDPDNVTTNFFYIGSMQAHAGDVNGDGYSDLITGSSFYGASSYSTRGLAAVYYGSKEGVINNPWKHVVEGEAQIGGRFGQRVSAAGDVNADGYADVLVAAPSFDVAGVGNNAGTVSVYLGSSSFVSSVPSYTSNSVNGFFAEKITGSIDINGDMYADVVVGAPWYSNGDANEGAVFVYHGSSIGLSNTVSWQWESNVPNAFAGSSLAGLSDLNGDGYADLVVGAPGYSNNESNEGAVFVFHGSAQGLSNTPVWQLESNIPSVRLGSDVSSAGDVNGDGYTDFAVGLPLYGNGHANEGLVRVYQGSRTGVSNAVPWQWEPNVVNAMVGRRGTLASLGDVNRDGYADTAIGSSTYTNGQSQEGAVYVFHGSSQGLANTPSFQTESNAANTFLGASVASDADVNGDGFNDMLVGAYGDATPSINAGSVYVFHGSLSGFPHTPSLIRRGIAANMLFGASVSASSDMNGDGFSDMVVTAPYGNPLTPSQAQGQVYVYPGSSYGVLSNAVKTYTDAQIVTISGVPSNALGSTAIGDINADGYDDIAVQKINLSNAVGFFEVYHGNSDDSGGSRPVSRPMGARVKNSTVPIPSWGKSHVNGVFDVVALRARPSTGRGGVKLQVETKPYNGVFDGTSNLFTSTNYTDSGVNGVDLTVPVNGLSSTVPVKWRARLLYEPSKKKGEKNSAWQNGGVVRATASPAIAFNDVFTVSEGGTSTTLTGGASSVLNNDVPGDVQLFFNAVLVNAPSNGVLALASNGAFSYRHDGSETTSDVFRYKINDGLNESNTAQVSVAITPVNDPPVFGAVSDLSGATEDVSYTIPFSTLFTATQISDADSSPLTFKIINTLSGTLSISSTPVSSGTVFSNGQTMLWTPSSNANGRQVAFRVKAFDGTLESNDFKDIAVSVAAVNDPPSLLNSATLNGVEDTQVSMSYSALVNAVRAQDVENSPIQFLIEEVMNGVLKIGSANVVANTTFFSNSTQNIVWTPPLNQNGSMGAFKIKAYDGALYSNSSTITFALNAVNDAPVANNDVFVASQGDSSFSIPVLNNDTDIENSTLTLASIIQNASNGVVSMQDDGSILYSVSTDAQNDFFTYKITDGTLDSNQARVDIAFRQRPLLSYVNAIVNAQEDTIKEIPYKMLLDTSDATDPEGNSVSFRIGNVLSGSLTLDGQPVSKGVTLLSEGHTLEWDPELNSNGDIEAFSVRAFDGSLLSSNEVKVVVRVKPVNDAPTLVEIPKQRYVHPSSVDFVVFASDIEDLTSLIDVYGEDIGLHTRTAMVSVTKGENLHHLRIETLGTSGVSRVRVRATDSQNAFSERFFDVEVSCRFDQNNDGICETYAPTPKRRASSCAGCAGSGASDVWMVSLCVFIRLIASFFLKRRFFSW